MALTRISPAQARRARGILFPLEFRPKTALDSTQSRTCRSRTIHPAGALGSTRSTPISDIVTCQLSVVSCQLLVVVNWLLVARCPWAVLGARVSFRCAYRGERFRNAIGTEERKISETCSDNVGNTPAGLTTDH